MKARMNIKSIIMIMTIICLASMFFINICFAANTGKITTETARLREQPNTEAKVLELASIGDEVEILEEVEGWYKVKYKKITGYIRTDLLSVDNKEQNISKENTTNTTVEEPKETVENTTNTIVETPKETETNTTIQNETIENTVEENNAETQTNTIIKSGKYRLSENLKFKIIPLISAIELEEVNKDTEIEVTEILNDWAKVKTAEGKEGWVRADKLVLPETKKEEVKEEKEATEVSTNATQENTNVTKIMYINSQVVNVRKKADKTSEVIKKLTLNTEVKVLTTENGWSNVDINGTKGYIAENLLSSTKQETSRSSTTERAATNDTTEQQNTSNTKIEETKTQSKTETTTSSSAATTETTTSSKGNEIVAYAKQFLGCKYVYGGTTTKGFDCSGFTQYVYKNFGVNLNRTAAAQYSNGTSVKNLQAGDLVMFGKSGINHVGIYIGGNTFIHAANSKRGVTTDTLASGYYKTNYVGARRIF